MSSFPLIPHSPCLLFYTYNKKKIFHCSQILKCEKLVKTEQLLKSKKGSKVYDLYQFNIYKESRLVISKKNSAYSPKKKKPD